jgi:non-specific serine/threonine protein kinase
VFAGGWTLEAAEVVCADDDGPRTTDDGSQVQPVVGGLLSIVACPDVLDLLTSLVDKSLVLYDEPGGAPRYRLLETVRQYSLEHLVASGGYTEIATRHRDWYVQLAVAAEPELKGPDQKRWAEQLEAEHDNLRAALSWCSQASDGAEPGLRLAGALWRFWVQRGHLREGRARLEAVLSHPDAQTMSSARADALNGAGALASYQGESGASRHLFEQVLLIRRALGDRLGVARSLTNLGRVAAQDRDSVAARQFLEESLAISREMEEPWLVAAVLANLGVVAHEQGHYDSARAFSRESLALWRELGDLYEASQVLDDLGLTETVLGEHDAARRFLREGLAMRRELGDRPGVAESLDSLAGLSAAEARSSGDPRSEGLQHAARIWGAAALLREELGSPIVPSDLPQHERDVAAAREALGEEVLHAAWAEGRALPLAEAIALALGEGAGA